MELIFKLLNITSYEELAVLILQVILFIAVFYFCYISIKYLIAYRVLKSAIDRTYSRLSDSEKIRLNLKNEQKLVYGDIEEKGIINKLDKIITYSGLKYKYKFINTETILLFWIIQAALAIIISSRLNAFMYGLLFAICVVVMTYMGLSIFTNIQYKAVHKSILKFVNIIENFAATSNDIITILEKSCAYAQNPIKDAVYRCVVEARNSGDKDFALRRLQDSIENEYFKEMIRTLRIASSYEANYSEVVRDCKAMLQQSLKYEAEKQSIRNNGRNDMLTLTAVGVICVFLTESISGYTVAELLFETGLVGQLLFYYLVFCLLVVIYVGFIKGMRR